jgi:cytochrome c5
MAEHHIPEHSSPSKTPKRLIMVIVLALVVPIAIVVMLTQFVTNVGSFGTDHPGMSEEAIAKRLKPVAEVVVAGAAPAKEETGGKAAPAAPAATPAPATAPAPAPAVVAKADSGKGKAVYESACVACHGTGVAGAPKTGDKPAWAARLKGGMDALYAASIKGKNAMPPKGGNLSLADADVKAAVDYMVGLVK